jgi:hypothetical protein
MGCSLPSLGEQCGSSSDASENKEHEEAILEEREFKLLDSLPKVSVNSRIWNALGQKTQFEWGSESDIQTYVKLVMWDAIAYAGLENKLECFNELGVVRLRPDIWVVVKVNKAPIGVIEVKKPGKEIMNNKRVHGQIYDSMLRLRHFFGQQNVFGIVSTYKQWRIYWLPDSDDSARATKTDIAQDATIEMPNVIPSFTGNFVGDSKDCPRSPVKRIVYGSRILEWNNSSLPSYLVSVILKMYYSRNYNIKILDAKRSYIILNKTSWFWGPLQVSSLDYGTLPSKNTKNLYLLIDLKGGNKILFFLIILYRCSWSSMACL